MMNRSFTLLYILSLSILFSCQSGEREVSLLHQAEQCMEAYPDSALALLEAIASPEQMALKDRAAYALLLTQAHDKNYLTHQSDSLIAVAVEYYAKTKDQERKAKAYFYLGSVYRDMNMPIEAIEAFLEVLEIKEGKEDRIAALAYGNLGDLYLEQKIYDQAVEAARSASRISLKLNREDDAAYHFRNLARNFRFTDQPDSSLFYYKQSLEIIVRGISPSIEHILLSDIGHQYLRMNLLDTAYTYLTESLSKYPVHKHAGSTYFLMGRLFNEQNELDSARYYLLKCLDSENINVRAASSEQLAQIEEKAGNYREATIYNNTYNALRDTIQSNIQTAEAARLIYRHETSTKKEKIFSTKNYIGIATGLLLFIIAIRGYYHRKQEKEEETHPDNSEEPADVLPVVQEAPTKEQAEIQEEIAICLENFKSQSAYSIFEKANQPIVAGEEPIHLKEQERRLLQSSIESAFVPVSKLLKKNYTKLSKDDLYYCLLYLMGCQNQQVLIINCTGYGALRTRKARIKRKMQPSDYLFIFKKP